MKSDPKALAFYEELFRIYRKRFSIRNQEIMDLYFRERATLSEIAGKFEISRQRAHQIVHICQDDLMILEEDLGIQKLIQKLNFVSSRIRAVSPDAADELDAVLSDATEQ